MDMATTVIIAARNEEKTIGKIIATFNKHPETQGNVYVGIDADTNDLTSKRVWANHGCAVHTDQRGKGQVVNATLSMVMQHAHLSHRIILCDGDYTGLTIAHIDKLLTPKDGMTIGVPDWPTQDVPAQAIKAWPLVSGFRCLPYNVIPGNAHGYLLETQINKRVLATFMTIRHVFMNGLKSPFQWPLTQRRMAELERDREWGERNGVL